MLPEFPELEEYFADQEIEDDLDEQPVRKRHRRNVARASEPLEEDDEVKPEGTGRTGTARPNGSCLPAPAVPQPRQTEPRKSANAPKQRTSYLDRTRYLTQLDNVLNLEGLAPFKRVHNAHMKMFRFAKVQKANGRGHGVLPARPEQPCR